VDDVFTASLEMDEGDEYSDTSPNHLESRDKSCHRTLAKGGPGALAQPRPDSAASSRSASASTVEQHHAQIERLQSRLDALRYENEQLQSANNPKAIELANALQLERDHALDRVSVMESQIKTLQRSLNERDLKADGLQRTVNQALVDLESQRSEGANRLKELQSKLEDSEVLIQELKVAIEAKQGRESENNAVLKARNAEVALLQSRVDKAYTDFENERRELAAQVSELREAGQVWNVSRLYNNFSPMRFAGDNRTLRGTLKRRRQPTLRA
jgi:CAP-Gly domain-containing linker protein 1